MPQVYKTEPIHKIVTVENTNKIQMLTQVSLALSQEMPKPHYCLSLCMWVFHSMRNP